MTETTVRTDIHQALDAQLDFRAEQTFDLKLLGYDGTDCVRLLRRFQSFTFLLTSMLALARMR